MHLFRCQHHSLTFVQLTCLQSILLTYLFPMMLLSQSLCLTTLSHLIVNFSIQDLSDLTDPTISLSGSYVAQIMWDAFESRYGYGLPSLLLMLLPLGAIFFCGMSSITSASRCPLKMIVMDCQSKHMCINMKMSFRCSNVTSFCVLSFENVLYNHKLAVVLCTTLCRAC